MNTEKEFREPNAFEEALFKHLLSAEFPGREEISRQLQSYKVRIIDEDGSLAIRTNAIAPRAPVEKTIPVEAEGADEDGIHLHFLLFVKNGFVNELEIYKDDGSQIKRLPAPGNLEVIVLPP